MDVYSFFDKIQTFFIQICFRFLFNTFCVHFSVKNISISQKLAYTRDAVGGWITQLKLVSFVWKL